MKNIPTANATQKAIVAMFASMVPGAFYRVQWTRNLKVRKHYAGVTVTKTVSAMVKAGIEYDNRTIVQTKRESGQLPSVNAGLPWGEWFDYPRTIVHKSEFYLRFYPATEFGKTEASYWLQLSDGTSKIISADVARTYCLASEFSDGTQADCFTVKLANLLSMVRVTPNLKPTSPNWENTVESFLTRD